MGCLTVGGGSFSGEDFTRGVLLGRLYWERL